MGYDKFHTRPNIFFLIPDGGGPRASPGGGQHDQHDRQRVLRQLVGPSGGGGGGELFFATLLSRESLNKSKLFIDSPGAFFLSLTLLGSFHPGCKGNRSFFPIS